MKTGPQRFTGQIDTDALGRSEERRQKEPAETLQDAGLTDPPGNQPSDYMVRARSWVQKVEALVGSKEYATPLQLREPEFDVERKEYRREGGWPTPETALEEEKRKAQERPEKEEKDEPASNKSRPKEKWIPVPFVPSVNFATLIPPRRGRGRGGERGGRESNGRRSYASNGGTGGEKVNHSSTATASATGDQGPASRGAQFPVDSTFRLHTPGPGRTPKQDPVMPEEPPKTPGRWADLFRPAGEKSLLQPAAPKVARQEPSTKPASLKATPPNAKASANSGSVQIIASTSKPATSAKALFPQDTTTPAQQSKDMPSGRRKASKQTKNPVPLSSNLEAGFEFNSSNLDSGNRNPTGNPTYVAENTLTSSLEEQGTGTSHEPEPLLGHETTTIERDIIAGFKGFASQQRRNVDMLRAEKAKKDKEVKLHDLKKFAESFHLQTPVPSDLVQIIAKDPAKQREIIRKTQENYARSDSKMPIP